MQIQPADLVDTDLLERQLSGETLYGDDLSPSQLQAWYDEEETASFDLAKDFYAMTDANNGDAYQRYGYTALNHFHAISTLSSKHFHRCVALGCAAGDDVTQLAPIVDAFVAIEPAEKWWRAEIGGKPSTYMKPTVSGDIDLPPNSADLATSFGVLHHIPNVSHVTREVARVLCPGGIFVVREPISWMGDWRNVRPGLTKNERGLPVRWFERTAQLSGFNIVRRHFCMFQPVAIVVNKLGVSPYASRIVTRIDWIFSEVFRWNNFYRRDSVMKKFAPGSAFWILRKR